MSELKQSWRDESPEMQQVRNEFERQHNGRDLRRHNMRGTYQSATIAALWNQHLRTIEWLRRTQPEAAKPAQDLGEVKTWQERFRQRDLTQRGNAEPEMLAEIADLRAALLQTQENSDDISAHLKAKNDTVNTLRAALASPADALVAVDRMDAERYRWLREQLCGFDFKDDLGLFRMELDEEGIKLNNDGLDKYIDRNRVAIQAQKDGHG